MSNTNLAVRLYPETLRSLAFGSIGAGYAAVGTSFANPARILILQNLTDTSMFFSFDGTNNHFILPSGGQMIIDCTTNRTAVAGTAAIAQGTIVYVKQVTAPSLGAVYVGVIYGII